MFMYYGTMYSVYIINNADNNKVEVNHFIKTITIRKKILVKLNYRVLLESKV